jgi:hypothetical protein
MSESSDNTPENFVALIRAYCSDFGVRCSAPYRINSDVHGSVEFCAFLPDFGSANGMLIGAWSPSSSLTKSLRKYLSDECGFYISFVNPGALHSAADFADCLMDWGYFGDDANYNAKISDMAVHRYR